MRGLLPAQLEEEDMQAHEQAMGAPDSAAQGALYHSVELSLEKLEVHYQFKLWRVDSMPMCILVKEDSDLLGRLKVGDILNMKYYSAASRYPSPSTQTLVRHITKECQGRFRGHYLVSLEIVGCQQ